MRCPTPDAPAPDAMPIVRTPLIGSASSGGPRAFSSGWPSRSAETQHGNAAPALLGQHFEPVSARIREVERALPAATLGDLVRARTLRIGPEWQSAGANAGEDR